MATGSEWRPMETAPKDGTPIIDLIELPPGSRDGAICVWRASEVPECLRNLVSRAGEGALVVFVPDGMEGSAAPILAAMEYGCFLGGDRHPLKGGFVFVQPEG